MILELFRKCGIVVSFMILELSRKCGIVASFMILEANCGFFHDFRTVPQVWYCGFFHIVACVVLFLSWF